MPTPMPSGSCQANARTDRGTLPRLPAILLWAAALWFFAFEFAIGPWQTPGVDFPKHRIAAHLLLAGENPYVGENEVNYLFFNYPMLVAFASLHMAAFTRIAAEHVWDVTNAILVVLTVMLAATARPSKPEASDMPLPWQRVLTFVHDNWLPLVAFFMVSFKPLHRAMNSGNIEPLNLLIGTTFVVAFTKRRDRLAGVAFAFFCLVKVVPVFLFIPLAVLKRTTLLLTSLIVFACYGLLLAATGWWRWELFLVTEVLPNLPFQWLNLSMSVHHFTASLLRPEVLETRDLYKSHVSMVSAVLLSLFIALCAWWWKTRRKDEEILLGFGFLFLLLSSPLVEAMHFIWVMPAALLQARAIVHGQLDWKVSCICMAGWLGTYWMDVLPWLPGVRDLVPHKWWAQTFVLLFLFACTAITVFRRQDASSPPILQDSRSPRPTEN